jgi:hypothetical protein
MEDRSNQRYNKVRNSSYENDSQVNTITKRLRELPSVFLLASVTVIFGYFISALRDSYDGFWSSRESPNLPAPNLPAPNLPAPNLPLGGGPSVSVSHCNIFSVNGDVSCSPPGCSINCPEMTQTTGGSQRSISCHKTTVGSTTTCEPARCTSGCPGYEISSGDRIAATRADAAQLREQYGMQSDRSSASIARPLTDVELATQVERVQNSGRRLCRDAASAYYCSFVERCGRGSCIPPNRIRCDDKPDGSTYDCRKGQTCGKGICIPFGKKLCDTDSQSRFCIGLNACCRGTLPTNSQVSCFSSSSCPAGTVQVMEYQHLDYQYSGEET